MTSSHLCIRYSSQVIITVREDTHAHQDYSAVLVIPDFWEREYVREMIHLLVNQMGFKQICIQQVILGLFHHILDEHSNIRLGVVGCYLRLWYFCCLCRGYWCFNDHDFLR
jgi:hypothetical protein